MSDGEALLRVIRILAAHRVLPPPEALPPSDEAFHALLADLARGGGSSHAGTLRAVSADLRIPVEELSRRAQFLLACLLLPASGTHYEVLGVARDATKQEIRKRWAALIQRYHPDRLGGASAGSGWLDGQARRLIEAYHTLKDPARRRAYDAQLAGEDADFQAPAMDQWRERTIRFVGPSRWKWVPAGIAAVGIAAGAWFLTRPAPASLPRGPLPAAPRLLDRWGTANTLTGEPVAPIPHRVRASRAGARNDAPQPTERAVVAELRSLKHRLAAAPLDAPPPRPPTESSAASPAPAADGRTSAAEPPATPFSRVATPLVAARGLPSAPPSPEHPSAVSVFEAPAPPPAPSAVRSGLPTSTAVSVPAPAPPVLAPPVEPAPLAPQPAAPAPLRAVEPASSSKPVQPAVVAASPSPAPHAVTPPAASPPGPAPGMPKPPPPAVVAATPTAAAPAAETPARAETLALIESFRAAYERKDLTAVMALFGTEARDRDVSGRQAVKQLYVRNFAALDGIRYDLGQLGVKPPAGNGDLVVEGRYRIRATHLVGKPRAMDVAGPIRWLLRREDGTLRIVAVEYETPAR